MCFTAFTVFCVHKYCFHAYICTIIGQSRFLFFVLSSNSCQMFREIKMKMESFDFYYYKLIVFNVHFYYYNGLIKCCKRFW